MVKKRSILIIQKLFVIEKDYGFGFSIENSTNTDYIDSGGNHFSES